jgi:hypothetical protein
MQKCDGKNSSLLEVVWQQNWPLAGSGLVAKIAAYLRIAAQRPN